MQVNWLKGVGKFGMTLDVLLEDSSLSHNLSGDDIKAPAADAENGLFVRESSVRSFEAHRRA
ncbi:MAG: hypothetical protein ACYTE8_09655 [Planctomycetota bacterium]